MEKLSDIYQKVRYLRKKEDFDSLAVYMHSLEDMGVELSPYLLTVKSQVIQLTDECNCYTLENAEESLLRAIQLEPKNVDAHVEIGYFYYAVSAQSDKAIPFFECAEKYAEEFLLDAILGKAKALVDLDKTNEAQLFLSESYFAKHPDVEDFLQMLELSLSCRDDPDSP